LVCRDQSIHIYFCQERELLLDVVPGISRKRKGAKAINRVPFKYYPNPGCKYQYLFHLFMTMTDNKSIT